jgi:hypothetical protein
VPALVVDIIVAERKRCPIDTPISTLQITPQ